MTFEDFAPHTIRCLPFFVVAIDLLFAVAVEINNYTINAVYINNLKHYLQPFTAFSWTTVSELFHEKVDFCFCTHHLFSENFSLFTCAQSFENVEYRNLFERNMVKYANFNTE